MFRCRIAFALGTAPLVSPKIKFKFWAGTFVLSEIYSSIISIVVPLGAKDKRVISYCCPNNGARSRPRPRLDSAFNANVKVDSYRSLPNLRNYRSQVRDKHVLLSYFKNQALQPPCP